VVPLPVPIVTTFKFSTDPERLALSPVIGYLKPGNLGR
jgi:hypothetical protein